MTVPRQDQDPSDVDNVASARDQLQEDIVIVAPEGKPSKSPSVATNSGTPPIGNQATSKARVNVLAANDNTTESADTSHGRSSLNDEDAQDESMSSRSKLSSRHTATTPTPTSTSKKPNPFLVQNSAPKCRYSTAALLADQDSVDESDGEGEGQEDAVYFSDREPHSDYSSGTSTPTLAITQTLARPSSSLSAGPSSPSTRPMTRSTSKKQVVESLDQDDEREISLMHLQRQPQTTPTHRIGSRSGQPQPVKRNHTADLWGRAYYEPSRNSSLIRTPSKKRNAQGEPIRFMSPPGRAFDPLSYDPLTQYKLKIPRLSDQEDNDDTQEEIDSEQDGPLPLATQKEEGDSFRTPKRKRRSRLPLMKLERPFAVQSHRQLSCQERNEQDPEARQEGEVQGDDDSAEENIALEDQQDVYNDVHEEEDEDTSQPSAQSTPNKYKQRDRLLLDLNSRGSSNFLEYDFQTPPRKATARDHFNNLQPPPAPRVPDWAMFSHLSDRQSRYGTPGWTPASGSQAGDSPSRKRSLRTPSFGSKLESSKNPRN